MLSEQNELSFETICRLAYDYRKNGKVVGFTHGAFDMFHYGHLHMLRRSAEKCDFLIVAIESDENVALYKSTKRPIVPEKERLEILNEVKCVGTTFVNRTDISEHIYGDIYKELNPNFVSIGISHSYEDKVRSLTAKLDVGVVKIDHNFVSTTELIDRVAKRYR